MNVTDRLINMNVRFEHSVEKTLDGICFVEEGTSLQLSICLEKHPGFVFSDEIEAILEIADGRLSLYDIIHQYINAATQYNSRNITEEIAFLFTLGSRMMLSGSPDVKKTIQTKAMVMNLSDLTQTEIIENIVKEAKMLPKTISAIITAAIMTVANYLNDK